MPKIIPALSDIKIRNATPKTDKSGKVTRKTLFDGKVTGLHVLVQPNGAKLWRLKYRINGKDVRATLIGAAPYPRTSLVEAREIAEKMLAKVRQGIDPAAPVVAPTADTFKDVAEDFVKWKKTVIADATVKKYRECLENDLYPAMGHRDIKEIHAPEVIPLLRKIEKRSYSLAQKCLELVTMVVRYAIQEGRRPPYTMIDMAGVLHKHEKKPKKIPSSIQRTFKSVETYSEFIMRSAMQLQFLCFLRSGESMGGLWTEVDFKKKEWSPAAKRMKMKRPHIVPLSAQAISILKELKKNTGHTPWLFPSKFRAENCMHRDSLSKSFREHGLGIVPHGCRTAASTWGKNNGFAPHAVELQLAHKESKNEVEAAYHDKPHLMYMTERVKFMQAWADHLYSTEIEKED